MTFEEFWQTPNILKPITGDVRLTPTQFRKMLQQSYNAGVKHTRSNKSLFDEVFGQNYDGDK